MSGVGKITQCGVSHSCKATPVITEVGCVPVCVCTCACVCVRVCTRACVHACVRVKEREGGRETR